MSYSSAPSALLALEDGRVFRGYSLGITGTCTGEICFNTSMSGYQEVLTDPSYRGQIVAMTYPLIGNYGTNSFDNEGTKPHIRGFVIEEMSESASSWCSQVGFQEYLHEHSLIVIGGVDTRALTRHLRISGAMRACLTSEPMSDVEAIALAKGSMFLEEMDLIEEVSTKEIYEWDPEGSEKILDNILPRKKTTQREPLVVAYDFGVKKNILRLLRSHGLRVMVVPSTTSPEDALAMNPEGIFFSNGPGDPGMLSPIHRTAHILSEHKPIFGICLGHQILGHAFGATTFKLKFGHRGANHPIQDLRTGRILITAQNHGYALDETEFPLALEVTHRHLNDGTVAGFRHRKKPVFAVQFHPEASPGPHDSIGLFQEFATMLGA
ncbi:MAG: carbamoyl phosphate synthase small subunit [Verrucomicrobia bacterium RIFCSPHIGHO2_12_FULL_41_10]|nr:MAG: carbamoyl phosphate synthase small subunit [Verrucomicrobia bacterium RIFCSPHIGHO2_12_FULL_41_10]